jgi:hypothetical protein
MRMPVYDYLRRHIKVHTFPGSATPAAFSDTVPSQIAVFAFPS